MSKAQKTSNQMNMILKPPSAGPVTMSSREIAELVESRHDKVKQSIERLAARGVIVQPPMGDEHDTDAMGRPRTTSVYLLKKRDSFVVVAQLSPEFTARLVDRWQELEGARQRPVAGAIPDLSNPHVLLQLLGDYAAKQIETEARAVAAEAQAEAARLDTEFVGRYVNTDGLYGLQNAARVLNQPPNKFVRWLKQRHLFYQGGELVPRATYRERGIFEVKATLINEKAHYRTFVTPKGIGYLAKKLGVEVAA